MVELKKENKNFQNEINKIKEEFKTRNNEINKLFEDKKIQDNDINLIKKILHNSKKKIKIYKMK